MLFRTTIVLSALIAVALGVTCPQVDNDGTPLSSTDAEGIITCNYPCQYSPDGTLVSGSSSCPKTLTPDESRRATDDNEGNTPDLGDGSDNPDNSTTFGAATCPAKIGDAAWTDASIQGDTLTCSYGTDTQCQFSELGKLTSGADGCPQLLAIANSTQTVVSCPFSDAEDNVWSTVRVSDTVLTCGYDGGSTCKYKSDGSLSKKKKKKSKKSKQDNNNDTRAASSCKPTAVVIQPDSSNNGTSTTTTGTSTATGTTTATGTDTTTTSTDTSTMTNTDTSTVTNTDTPTTTTTGTAATPTSTDNSDDNNKEGDSTTTTSTTSTSSTSSSSTSSTNTFSITPVPTITGPPRPNAALPSIPRGSLAAALFSIALGCILL